MVLLGASLFAPEDAPAADGPLAVHPDNHRCFIYHGRPLKLLCSAEHYGAVLNGDFAWEPYLAEMQRTGQNLTRVFTFYRELPTSIRGPGAMNTLAPRPEASILPWLRVTGHGQAPDGLDKFDLEQWNPAYFARFRDFIQQCDEHGMIVEVTLFCHPYNQEKMRYLPTSAESNINGVGTGLQDPHDFLSLDDPATVAIQERFVRKMAAELNDLDNFCFEICNEPRGRGDESVPAEVRIVAWQRHLAQVLREAEAVLPQRHLIAVNAHHWTRLNGNPPLRHDDEPYFTDPNIDILNYHYLSAKVEADGWRFRHLDNKDARAGAIGQFLRQRDRFAKPIVFDETFTGIVRGEPERYAINRAEAWEMLLSGGAGYDSLDWSFTVGDPTGSGQAPIGDGRVLDGRLLREWLQHLRDWIPPHHLSALRPDVELRVDGTDGFAWAASEAFGVNHYLYLVDEGLYRRETCSETRLALRLTVPAGRYLVAALDPQTGAGTDLGLVHSDATMLVNLPPFREDIALSLSMAR